MKRREFVAQVFAGGALGGSVASGFAQQRSAIRKPLAPSGRKGVDSRFAENDDYGGETLSSEITPAQAAVQAESLSVVVERPLAGQPHAGKVLVLLR
jgi:hypothetical protein